MSVIVVCAVITVATVVANLGALGLLLGLAGAIGVHLRAHEHRHVITTVGYFTLAAAALAASLAR